VFTRIGQRLLALAAATGHNCHQGLRQMIVIAYDH